MQKKKFINSFSRIYTNYTYIMRFSNTWRTLMHELHLNFKWLNTFNHANDDIYVIYLVCFWSVREAGKEFSFAYLPE